MKTQQHIELGFYLLLQDRTLTEIENSKTPKELENYVNYETVIRTSILQIEEEIGTKELNRLTKSN